MAIEGHQAKKTSVRDSSSWELKLELFPRTISIVQILRYVSSYTRDYYIVHLLNIIISFKTHNASFLFLQHRGIGHLFTIKISQFSTHFIPPYLENDKKYSANSTASKTSESWLQEGLLIKCTVYKLILQPHLTLSRNRLYMSKRSFRLSYFKYTWSTSQFLEKSKRCVER